MKRSTVYSILVSSLFICLGVWAFLHRIELADRWRLLGYTPSQNVVSLADAGAFTPKARRIFYASKPSIESRVTFGSNCPVSEETIVLGCYADRNIYVLNVEDDRLQGVEEVTAAHEMLHAAYERLSSTDRTKLNAQLEAAYAQLKDKSLTETLQSYEQSEPGQRSNELHSILATEYDGLTTELNEYYASYFTDRSKVVSFAKKYRSVFTSLQAQVTRYDEQLLAKKRTIELAQSSLAAQRSTIDTERQKMNSLLATNQTATYNASVPGFNALIARYNQQVAKLETEVAAYNVLVSERNKLALAQRELRESLQVTNQPVSQ